MTQDLASILARRFICRRDAKARQRPDGTYAPVRAADGSDEPWSMRDLADHLEGGAAYGHYLLDRESKTKLFCFDIDLNDSPGTWVWEPDFTQLPGWANYESAVLDKWIADNTKIYQTPSPRQDWKNRAHPARAWYKLHMRLLAEKLTLRITEELGVPAVAAYTGSKGIHVYGFTGHIPAAQAREGARLVLETVPGFEPDSGSVFWRDRNTDPREGFSNFTIEVFPKQDTVKGGGYGNLLRLPLGKNMKNPQDPCFFLDQTAPLKEFRPHPDPVFLLETGKPWARQ